MKHDLIFPVDRMAAAIEQTGLSQKLRVIDGTHINLAWQRSTIGRVVDVIDETEAAGTAETAA
jgi:predicted metal-dependent phosphoesterase TrpH